MVFMRDIGKLIVFLGSEMSSDDRAFLMQAVLSMNLEGSVPYFYPRLYPLVSACKFLSENSTDRKIAFIQRHAQHAIKFRETFSHAS